MQAIIYSALLVFVSEMGDKTQLLSLVLVARFKKPWVILLGVLAATLANHALAAWSGVFVSGLVSHEAMKWILALVFFAFAGWLLVPDKEGEVKTGSHLGVFATTFVSFFIAEMGDKTQFATIALAAKYASISLVTIGSTIGMLASNALAIFLGERLLQRIPMQQVRVAAAALFAIFGLAIIFGY